MAWLFLLLLGGALAFSPATTRARRAAPSRPAPSRPTPSRPAPVALPVGRGGARPLPSSPSDDDGSPPPPAADATDAEASRTRATPDLSEADRSYVASTHERCGGDADAMEGAIASDLDGMDPRLAVALQLAADGKFDDDDEVFESQMKEMGVALRNVLEGRLRSGRELLAELLGSGEIRKLDGVIGKAAREGRLDMSFFSVLDMNMRDAMLEDDGSSKGPFAEGEDGMPAEANRLQILQHIYTRCQEELEKNVSPGAGLLNKLLRTEASAIRANQLRHYLGPQATTITDPQGNVVELGGTGKPLVSHGEFVAALADAVARVRGLEAAGATDRLSAANLVEGMRRVAMEARAVLLESFGEESEALKEFQRDLQPVFRPGSRVEV